jgi:signal transduction histidine kinase
MSVIYKLTFSLFVLTLVVFGIYGTYQLRTEAQDLRNDVEKETRLLAHSLLVSVENALRDRQMEDVQELLQQIEHFKPSIDVRIYIQNRDTIRSGAETLVWPEEVKRTLYQSALDGEAKQFYFPEDNPDFLVMSLPFNKASNAMPGSLAMVRSLQKMKDDLSKTRTYILWSFVSLILFTTLLCFFLGQIYITRPLLKLRQAMQVFKNSTESPKPLPVNGSDEISSVTQEFNRMTVELFSAYSRLDGETQQRRQLQRALQEADKLITIGQLSAGLAHEIGSPLQIVNGRARALAGCAEYPDDVRRLADILVVQTDRITRIVHRLLEFARRRPPERVHCDVALAIAEVLDMLRYEVRRHNVELHFTRPETLPFMLTNRDGIQQIVLNLVSNALASIPDGGTISVDLHEAPLTRIKETVPALRLSVTDNGKGIAPEHVAQLFEPFFTTRGDQGGTGLGLAVVKAIITELRGTIVAESQPGEGSCFIVHLPLEEPL